MLADDQVEIRHPLRAISRPAIWKPAAAFSKQVPETLCVSMQSPFLQLNLGMRQAKVPSSLLLKNTRRL
jgi:hypothetical protein